MFSDDIIFNRGNEMAEQSIAIVLTCHNRKEKTKRCLETIINSSTRSVEYKYKIFICDDGSDDGTREMIMSFMREMDIELIEGNGDLFWARGMAKAIEMAEKFNPDFYLMINDDVDFYPQMIEIMLRNYQKHDDTYCAIVGCTQSSDKSDCSYGGFGWDSNGLIIQKNYRRLLPMDSGILCKWANWNCFLLPKQLYQAVGKIDSYYEHSFADYDYSNRIIRNGYRMFVADEYIGTCDRNPKENTYLDNTLPINKRLKLLHKRTARPPKSCWYYARKFYGPFSIVKFLEPYFYILVTSTPIFKKLRRA